jgi:hypothetical protein
VRVTVPLTRPGDDVEVISPTTTEPDIVRSASEKDPPNHCDLLRHNYTNKRAAIIGKGPTDARAHLLWSTISDYLTRWYEFELVSWPSEQPVDIVLADEHMLADLPRTFSTLTSLPPLIILCSRSIDYEVARMQWSPLADVVSIITRPCGPYKLARTIQKCFDSAKGTVSEQAQAERTLPFRPKTTLLTAANAIPEEEQKSFGILNITPDSTDGASSNTPNS